MEDVYKMSIKTLHDHIAYAYARLKIQDNIVRVKLVKKYSYNNIKEY